MSLNPSLVDGLTSVSFAIEQFVVSHWIPLCSSIVMITGLVAAHQSRRDSTLPRTSDVSTAYLRGDELVSVLVPAWNESNTIARTIAEFSELSYPHREMIVCAGGADDTYERATTAVNDDNVYVVEQTSEMNKQAALNACLQRARGEILYLVDGDCVLEDETWNAALKPIIEGSDTVVGGASRPLTEQWGRLLPTYQHLKEEFDRANRPKYVHGLLGRNVALKRSAMDDLGTFDESIQAGTDYNLAKRLLTHGHEIRFVPNSRIESEYQTSVKGYFDQQSRWLRNVFFLGREWDVADERRTTIVTCCVGIFMIVAPFIGLHYYPVLLGWFGGASYAVASRIRWLHFYRQARKTPVPNRVAVFAIGLMFVEFAAWTYAVFEIASPSRQRKW